uniref:Plus3 domain-containing protein n=1 Tax=Kalanchoe fedtschenkoi TaxID=63787 RepID=A0A7N0UCF7_KALFE
MSIEDGSKEPQVDLKLPSSNQNHCVLLNSSLGAGVNARVGVTFLAPHPLSELVWSPSKGISIKRADYSFTEKLSANLLNLGPNNMAVSSTKSIFSNSIYTDSFVDEQNNDVTSPNPVNFCVDELDASRRSTGSMVLDGLIKSQDEGVVSSNPYPSQVGPSCQHNVAPAFVEQEGQSMLKTPAAITATSDNLEVSAENYLLVEANKCENQITQDGNDKSCEHHEGVHVVDGSVLIERHPRNQRIEEELKEVKVKAFSDGDVNDQLADDINSHGSAGSCSSKRLAPSGKTKRNADQKLTSKSKRLKKSLGRDLDSATFIRQSSSFMSWITNMIKGYSGYNKDEAPSLILTHTEPQSHSQKRAACHQEFSGMGFRNVFQSLYRSDNSEEGARKIYLCYQKYEGSGDTKHNTMVDVSAVPLTARRTRNEIPEKFCLSNEMCDLPSSGSVIGSPSKQGMILPTDFPTDEDKSLFGMNNESCNVANGMEIAIMNPSNSGKGRAHTSEYNDSMNTSEEKAAQAIGHKRDYLGSQWVTRFCQKSSKPASYKHHHGTSKFISKRVLPTLESHGSSGKGSMNVVEGEHSYGNPMDVLREGCNGFARTDGLFGSGEMKVKYEQQSEHSLEAIASGFARRFDALKQIIPSDPTCKSAVSVTATTCFFCGASGHDLRVCSKMRESEAEELFQKISSYEKVKDSRRLCIKCFQISHWAIECPLTPSGKSALGSFSDRPSDIDLNSNRSNIEGRSFLGRNDHSPGTLHPQGTSGEGNFKKDTKPIQPQDDKEAVGARNPNDLEFEGLEADESSSPPLSVGRPHKIAVPVIEIFDALRRLRLSRSEFLRLKDSQISLSQLRGFYLRVRLSNWKEGLAGKSYHVACIHGAPNEQAGSKTRVTVTVGNFKGWVESQYVSNQDFIEEELLTWWSTSAKAGHNNQIPSLEELERKYQERKRLGF